MKKLLRNAAKNKRNKFSLKNLLENNDLVKPFQYYFYENLLKARLQIICLTYLNLLYIFCLCF